MYCPHCQKEIDNASAQFCPFCGAKLIGDGVTAHASDAELVPLKPQIFASEGYSFAIKADGTMLATGSSIYFKRDDLDKWSDIRSIACGINHIAGLKKDGTVVALGERNYGQCNVTEWKDVVSIVCCYNVTYGLTKDGKIYKTHCADYRPKLLDYRNVTSIYGSGPSFMFTFDGGYILTECRNEYGEGNVENWKDVVSIACANWHTLGLTKDGKVVATGTNVRKECEVKKWKNIVAIACGYDHSVGLMENGKVVATGDNQYGQCNVKDWKDIIAIACGPKHTLGLRKDGTVVATGYNKNGECIVNGWKLF